MDLQIKSSELKIKGKTGILTSNLKELGLKIESLNLDSSKSIVGPGEYEVSGISVIGIQVEDKTAYVYEVDGLRICNLIEFEDKLPEAKVSGIGDIDILILPVVSKSLEMMQQIEPYYVVPVELGKDGDIEKFLRDTGMMVEKMPKLSLKMDDIIEDYPTQVILLGEK